MELGARSTEFRNSWTPCSMPPAIHGGRASHAIVRASTYQEGRLKFHTIHDFVRKSCGCEDLRVVLFCILVGLSTDCGGLRTECRIWTGPMLSAPRLCSPTLSSLRSGDQRAHKFCRSTVFQLPSARHGSCLSIRCSYSSIRSEIN